MLWRRVRDEYAATVVAAAAGMVLSVTSALQTLAQPTANDFSSYYYAGRAAAAGTHFYDGEVLLALAKPDGVNLVYPYLYPPLLAQLLGLSASSLASELKSWLTLLVLSTL